MYDNHISTPRYRRRQLNTLSSSQHDNEHHPGDLNTYNNLDISEHGYNHGSSPPRSIASRKKYDRRSNQTLLRVITLRLYTLLIVVIRCSVIILVIILLLFAFNVRNLYLDARILCTPPPSVIKPNNTSSNAIDSNQRPLIEYYVHGRGNGHYARSVAIVEELLEYGVDVRMFIGRATMYKAVSEGQKNQQDSLDDPVADIFWNEQADDDNAHHQDSVNHSFQDQHHNRIVELTANHTTDNNRRQQHYQNIKRNYHNHESTKGKVTARSISSILPTNRYLDVATLFVQRILTDCQVSKNSNRYPLLVVTDGDVPGMHRASLGSLPSISISHGQTFVISQPPEWVKADPVFRTEWDYQAKLNKASGSITNWQIGTSFVPLEVKRDNAVIAQSPIRQEVQKMVLDRQERRKFGDHFMRMVQDQNNNVLGGGNNVALRKSSASLLQQKLIAELLVGREVLDALSVIHRNKKEHNITDMLLTNTTANLAVQRRKLVICYFRDKNGDLLQNALLESGVDVILFERGYHKGQNDTKSEAKFGSKWIVKREGTSGSNSDNLKFNNGNSTNNLEEYWRGILAKNDRKLLNDDRHGAMNQQRNFEQFQTNSSNKILINQLSESAVEELALNLTTNETNETLRNSTTDRNGRKHGETSEEDLQKAIKTIQTMLETQSSQTPKIFRISDLSLFVPLLAIADGVASSAGSQLLSECIFSNIPILALYSEKDGEQMLNVQLSNHRFHHLESESQRRDSNVVHGMSLEMFASIFSSTISKNTKSNTFIKNESDKLFPDKEDNLLLHRDLEAKESYTNFKAYVKKIQESSISWSYYHDLFRDLSPRSVDDYDTHLEVEENYNDNPFKGMKKASDVILEIIKQVLRDRHDDL